MQRFRGGLVFKAHRLCVSLNSRLESNREEGLGVETHILSFSFQVYSQFKNYYLTEMCSGSEAVSCLRLIDFVCHSTLGLKVIKQRRRSEDSGGDASDGGVGLGPRAGFE